jgi:D-cysteine desulfhydrase
MTPTPLERATRLTAAWGGPTIWVKRDDLTGFGLSGNKVRKLEFHLAAAEAAGADTVITCGATQSNHSRATALAAARTGFRTVLLLRHQPGAPLELEGNLLLDALAGAEVRLITPEQWPDRDELMAAEAAAQATAGHPTWVIPEGASDSLGMWGFVRAMRELADQLVTIEGSAPIIWHAASSGGTTAGIGWAVDRLGLKTPVVACSIGDPAAEISTKVNTIWRRAADESGAPLPATPIDYNDAHIGGGYGVVEDADLAVQAEATSLTGLIFDPTYTGKALTGLRREIAAGRYGRDDNIVFWHTGGGFAVFAHDFTRTVSVGPPV